MQVRRPRESEVLASAAICSWLLYQVRPAGLISRCRTPLSRARPEILTSFVRSRVLCCAVGDRTATATFALQSSPPHFRFLLTLALRLVSWILL